VAARLKGGNALGAVHEDDDRGEQVGERQLARGEDRPAGHAELVVAGDALELATARDRVSLTAAATRANRGAVILRPAHLAERIVSGFLAHAENRLQGEGASLGGEEEML